MLRVGVLAEAEVFDGAQALARELAVVLEKLLDHHVRPLPMRIEARVERLGHPGLLTLLDGAAKPVLRRVDRALLVHPVVAAVALLAGQVVGVRLDVHLSLLLGNDTLERVQQALRLVARYLLRRPLAKALCQDGAGQLVTAHVLLAQRLALARLVDRLLLGLSQGEQHRLGRSVHDLVHFDADRLAAAVHIEAFEVGVLGHTRMEDHPARSEVRAPLQYVLRTRLLHFCVVDLRLERDLARLAIAATANAGGL